MIPPQKSVKQQKPLRQFLMLFPISVRRRLVLAAFWGLMLAILEFSSLLLLYPVFGFLSDDSSAGESWAVPVFGW